jgi:hypothetical protein
VLGEGQCWAPILRDAQQIGGRQAHPGQPQPRGFSVGCGGGRLTRNCSSSEVAMVTLSA